MSAYLSKRRAAVVFGVNQAECNFLVRNVEAAALAGGDGAVQNVAEKFAVNLRVLSFAPECPEAPANLGLWRVCRKPQEIAVVAVNFNDVP